MFYNHIVVSYIRSSANYRFQELVICQIDTCDTPPLIFNNIQAMAYSNNHLLRNLNDDQKFHTLFTIWFARTYMYGELDFDPNHTPNEFIQYVVSIRTGRDVGALGFTSRDVYDIWRNERYQKTFDRPFLCHMGLERTKKLFFKDLCRYLLAK